MSTLGRHVILSHTEDVFDASDLLTIALLVALEGLLSADNAMVLAVLVLGLPNTSSGKALRYGILGAFVFRALATLLAVYLIARLGEAGRRRLPPVPDGPPLPPARGTRRRAARRPRPRPCSGCQPFWATVVKVELTDIVFAIDSILVAVAMSPKTVGDSDGRHPRHRHDAARHRPAARDRRAVSAARRRGVHHHRVGGHQADPRVPPRRRATSTSRCRSGCRSA